MAQISEYYDAAYFAKFRQLSWVKRLFIGWVDRKEPVLSFLRKVYRNREASLLDVGCGAGWFLKSAEHYFDCTGFDVSKEALEVAVAETTKTKLLQKSIYTLDGFKTQSFDVVTCFDTLEHVVGHDYILDHFFRILKSDGVLVISAPNAASISRTLKWQRWFGFKDPSHLWHFSPEEWGRLMNQHGFLPMRCWFNGLMDPPYVSWLPNALQEVLIKYPTQVWALLGLPLPVWAGETFFMVLVKNPGWQSDYRQQQQRLYAQARKS